jgi:hypothetical protein
VGFSSDRLGLPRRIDVEVITGLVLISEDTTGFLRRDFGDLGANALFTREIFD